LPSNPRFEAVYALDWVATTLTVRQLARAFHLAPSAGLAGFGYLAT
jgi:hypothetical protein